MQIITKTVQEVQVQMLNSVDFDSKEKKAVESSSSPSPSPSPSISGASSGGEDLSNMTAEELEALMSAEMEEGENIDEPLSSVKDVTSPHPSPTFIIARIHGHSSLLVFQSTHSPYFSSDLCVSIPPLVDPSSFLSMSRELSRKIP